MGYKSATFEHFFTVVWGDARESDFDEVIARVADLERSAGRPVAFLGIMPDEMPPLNDEQRKGYMRLTDGILKHCTRVAVAMEAKGFRGSIIRSAMAAMTLLMGRRDRLHFVSTTKEALDLLERDLPAKAGVLEAIQRVGVTLSS